jgi:hypothetical protein
MPKDADFFEFLSGLPEDPAPAPARLESRLYSALIRKMQEAGPLENVGATEATDTLCVFEKLVQISPLAEQTGSANFCRVCHARILGETLDHAPIYWKHCPYSQFHNG